MVLGQLVQRFLKSITRDLFNKLHFTYCENQAMDNAVSLAPFFILPHLNCPNHYAPILFLDFSSAFNTIVPQKLFEKLQYLSVPLSLCCWILDFLVDHPKSVKLNNLQSSTIVLNSGAPKGCVLSPLLYSLFTNDCFSHHVSVQLIRFACDTTVKGLIKNSDESAYHQEKDCLMSWCGRNNLDLNTSKTKEMIMDFRRKKIICRPTADKWFTHRNCQQF